MGLTRANKNDQRKRYTHQAFDVTYGGLSPETAKEGYGLMAAATYAADFEIDLPEAPGTYRFNVPPHLYGSSYSVIKSMGGTATGTVTLKGEAGDTILLAALTDLSAKVYNQALTNPYPHDNSMQGQETIEVVIAGAPAGPGTLVLHLHIAQSGWK